MTPMLSVLFLLNTFASANSPATNLDVAMSDVGPFSYMEDSKVRGINFEILDQISKKSGLNFNYKFYPHLRLTNSIEATNADLAIFFSASCLKYPQTYEIQTKLYTSKPTLFLKESVTLKKENLRIGLIRGTCLNLSEKYLKPEMITEVSDMNQAVEMLKAGRLDGVCGLGPVVNFSFSKNKNFSEKLLPIQTDSQILEAVICRKKSLSKDVKKKLEDAMKTVKVPHVE